MGGKRYGYRRQVKYTALEVKERRERFRREAAPFKRHIHGIGTVYFGEKPIIIERDEERKQDDRS